MALNRSRWSRCLRWTPCLQWLHDNPGTASDWVSANTCGSVLDFSCSDRWLRPRLPDGCDYIALDYPPTGGEIPGARPEVFDDTAQLPFAGTTIDTSLLLEILERLRHPAQDFSEMARVLKPGGQLLLTMPFLYPIHDATHNQQRRNWYGLVREIEAVGDESEKVETSFGTMKSDGSVLTLALGGIARKIIARRSLTMLLLPAPAFAIRCRKLCSWLLRTVLGHWPALMAGYRVRATRW